MFVVGLALLSLFVIFVTCVFPALAVVTGVSALGLALF